MFAPTPTTVRKCRFGSSARAPAATASRGQAGPSPSSSVSSSISHSWPCPPTRRAHVCAGEGCRSTGPSYPPIPSVADHDPATAVPESRQENSVNATSTHCNSRSADVRRRATLQALGWRGVVDMSVAESGFNPGNIQDRMLGAAIRHVPRWRRRGIFGFCTTIGDFRRNDIYWIVPRPRAHGRLLISAEQRSVTTAERDGTLVAPTRAHS